jgi:hypothetical protein
MRFFGVHDYCLLEELWGILALLRFITEICHKMIVDEIVFSYIMYFRKTIICKIHTGPKCNESRTVYLL